MRRVKGENEEKILLNEEFVVSGGGKTKNQIRTTKLNVMNVKGERNSVFIEKQNWKTCVSQQCGWCFFETFLNARSRKKTSTVSKLFESSTL